MLQFEFYMETTHFAVDAIASVAVVAVAVAVFVVVVIVVAIVDDVAQFPLPHSFTSFSILSGMLAIEKEMI